MSEPQEKRSIWSFFLANTSARQTVLKNTFWIFVSQIGGRVIRAVIVIYAARVIGVANYGIFSYAVSITAILGVFADCGIDTAVFKRSSQYPDRTPLYFANAFAIKLVLLVISILLITTIGPFVSKIPEANILIPFISLIFISDVLREFGITVSRATNRTEQEAFLSIVTNILIVIAAIIAIHIRPTAQFLTIGYAIGTTLGSILVFFFFKTYFRDLLKNLSKSTTVELITTGVPLMFTGILGVLMINTDMLLLGWWRTAEEIGYYSAAQRPISTIYAFLGIIPVAMFPAIARMARTETEKFERALKRVIQVSGAITIPMVVGGIILAAPIMTLLYGSSYLPGTQSFQVLLLTLITNFLIILLTYVLLSHNEERLLIWSSIIGLVSNAFFDVILIPQFGPLGSAIATFANQLFMAAFLWRKVRALSQGSIRPNLGKIIFAAVGMGFATWGAAALGIPVLIIIPIAALLYFAALYIFKEESVAELRDLATLAMKKTGVNS